MDRPTGPARASRSGIDLAFVACGIAVGATLMYFLDPDNGRRRRALMADKSRHYARVGIEQQEGWVRHAAHRARGTMASARRHLNPGELVEDRILLERVRAALGHVVGDPLAVDVRVRCGTVILKGPARQEQMEELVACATRVPGVLAVENRLSLSPEGSNDDGATGLGGVYPDGIAR